MDRGTNGLSEANGGPLLAAGFPVLECQRKQNESGGIMGLSYSEGANSYKVWLDGETKPVEVKAESIREEGSILFFYDRGRSVVFAAPVSRVKSVRHSSMPAPGMPKAKSGPT